MDFIRFDSAPLFWIIVWVLAVWRFSSILSREKIARFYRGWFGVIEGLDGNGEPWQDVPDTLLGYLVTCLWCTSVWVSILLMPLVYFIPVILLPFAVSAAAIFFESRVKA